MQMIAPASVGRIGLFPLHSCLVPNIMYCSALSLGVLSFVQPFFYLGNQVCAAPTMPYVLAWVHISDDTLYTQDVWDEFGKVH